MATQTLRPNSTVSGGRWTRTGGSTKHGVLADDSDSTYLEVTAIGEFEPTNDYEFGLTAYTLAAGERVKRARTRLRARTDGGVPVPNDIYAYYKTAGGTLGPRQVHNSGGSITTKSGSWSTDGFQVADQQTVIDGLLAYGIAPGETVKARMYEVYVDLDVWESTDAPTVAITEESAGTVSTTDKPTVESYVAAANDGTPTQWTRQVRVFRDAVYLAGGFDAADETDVEWEDTDTAFSTPSIDSGSPDTIQVGSALTNSDTYRAYVRYGKNDVAGETLWSGWSYAEFALSVSPPTAPAIAVTVEDAEGRQEVVVTTAALTHASVESVELQRSDDGGTTWATIRGGLLDDVAASTGYTFYDYDAPRDTALEYRARTTEAAASGLTLASAWATDGPDTHASDGRVWMYDVNTWEHVGAVAVARPATRDPHAAASPFDLLEGGSSVLYGEPGGDRIGIQVVASEASDVEAVEALARHRDTLLVKWHDGTQQYVRLISASQTLEDFGSDRPVRRWRMQAVEVESGI